MPILEPGSDFGAYEILGLVGEGAMGVVYRARDIDLDREVALKVIDEKLARNEEFRVRFLQEARLAARIDHPAVVTVFQVGEQNGLPFMAMRLVKGADFHEFLENHGGRLSLDEAIRILRPIAEGLDAAHAAGVVHRDVKPENILVPSDGSPAILADFGIGRAVQGARATQTGTWMGTVDYVAPEQAQGRDVDGRADQYALACVMYEAIAGNPPFRRDEPLQTLLAQATEPMPDPAVGHLDPTVREAVVDSLRKALSKDANARYSNCQAFVSAIAVGPDHSSARSAGRTGTIVGDVHTHRLGPSGTVVGPAHAALQDPATSSAATEPAARRSRGWGKIAMGVTVAVLLLVGSGWAYLLLQPQDRPLTSFESGSFTADAGALSADPVVDKARFPTCSFAATALRTSGLDLAGVSADWGNFYDLTDLLESSRESLRLAGSAMVTCRNDQEAARGSGAALGLIREAESLLPATPPLSGPVRNRLARIGSEISTLAASDAFLTAPDE